MSFPCRLPKLVVRAACYVVAIGVLAFVAGLGNFPLTLVAAIAVAVAGIAFHQLTANGHLGHCVSPGPRALLCGACVEAGVLILWWQDWRVLGRVGFIGLSLLGFGLGQLMAEIRTSRSMRCCIGLLLWINALVAIVLALGFGIGGVPLLVIGVVVAVPAIALTSEELIAGLSALNFERAELRLRSPLRMVILASIGVTLAIVGIVALDPPGGLRVALIVAALLFVALFAIASNTDADILLVVFVVAIAWSQFPRGDESRPIASPTATHNVVVLGDSYISGEGARSYFQGTNTRAAGKRNECRQSTKAWHQLLYGTNPDVVLDDLACSGASVDNISEHGEGQYVGENPSGRPIARPDDPDHILSQLEQWDLRQTDPARAGLQVSTVYVSIGGNDAGFGDVVAACVSAGDCSLDGQRRLDDLRTMVAPRLDGLYGELATKFGADKVVVVPYPVGIAVGDDGAECSALRSTFTRRERQFLAGFTRQLDDVIRYEAAQHGLRYAEGVVDAVKGHRICETDVADTDVNSVAANPVGGDTDPTAWLHNSMHPNEFGHADIARAIEQMSLGHLRPPAASSVQMPALSLTRIMDDGVVYCGPDNPDPSSGCTTPPTTSSFDQLRHAIVASLAAIVLMVVGCWVLALSVLARRNAVRKLMTAEYKPRLSHVLDRVPGRLQRFGIGIVGVAGAMAAFVVLLNVVTELPGGYGWAQSSTASELHALGRSDLRRYLAATGRDIAVYVPAYVLFGAVLILIVAARRFYTADNRPVLEPNARMRYRFYKRVDPRTWWAIGLLVLAGVADIAETWLFRTSVRRLLLDGGADVGALATWTRVCTVIKVVGIGSAFLMTVVWGIARRRITPPPPAGVQETLPIAA